MTALSPQLADVLRRIAAADAAGGGDIRFMPYFADHPPGPFRVIPPIDGHENLQAGRISALRELGLLDVEPAGEGSSEFGAFRITAAGRDAIARYREPGAAAPAPSRPMDTSWNRARPVLTAVVQRWEQLGAADAVDTDAIAADMGEEMTGAEVRRTLELLERDGYLDAQHEAGTDGPIAVTPEPKALHALRAWPTGAGDAEIVQGLLAALDEAIEGASDPEEQSRLRRLRSAAADVGKSVLAGAIVAAGKMAAGG